MEKIHIISYGCSNNFHEGEVMAGLLEKAGYEITKDSYDAHVIILNLCTVKGDHQAVKALKNTTKHYTAKIIAAGCILESTKNTLREHYPSLSLVNTNNIDKIVDIVEAVVEGAIVESIDNRAIKKINVPKIRLNPIINIVPVGNGCTSACTYCSVKLIKGNIQSYLIEQILEEVKSSVNDGCKEIYLTGQDTGAYGLEWKNGKELPELLDAIVQIPGDFMIRVGMTSPNHVLRHLDRLITIYYHPKIYKFLHIPVQSGNNNVLKNMKRPYTAEQYKHCIKEFKKAFPEITIATDIIVGFPGETEEEFEDTVLLLKETTPDAINISRFSPRPGTIAAKMKQIATNIAKERSKKITDIEQTIVAERNALWKGWSGNVIVDEHGKNNVMIARNNAYKQILLKGTYTLGEEVMVTIKETGTYDLRAFEKQERENAVHSNGNNSDIPALIQVRV